MECLEIDWKNIDHTYVRDEFYESIQAPMWIDFTVPEDPVDDDDWFCGKAGCFHEKKSLCQAAGLIRTSKVEPKETSKSLPFQVPNAMTAMVAPLGERAVSAATGKRARGVVSSSLSSLPDMKPRTFVKSKVSHHTKMPPIIEGKGQGSKKLLRQASENENPNQTDTVQEGIAKKTSSKVQEGIAKKIKRSEPKDAGRAPAVNMPIRGVTARVLKEVSTLSEQENDRVVAAVAKVVVAKVVKPSSLTAGKGQSQSLVGKVARKDLSASVPNLSADVKKSTRPEGTATLKDLSGHSCKSSRSGAKTPQCAIPLAAPSKKIVVPRPLQRVCLNEKSTASRQPRIFTRKENKSGASSVVRVTDSDCTLANAPTQLEKNGCEQEKITSEGTQTQGEVQILEIEQRQQPQVPVKEDENALHDQQSRIGEDAGEQLANENGAPEEKLVQDTLESFLRNLRLTPEERGILSSSDSPGDCHNAQEEEFGQSVRSSGVIFELGKPLSSYEGGSHAMSLASVESIADCMAGEKSEVSNKKSGKEIKQKQQRPNLHLHSDRPMSQGKKRKSSELNLKVNCSSKEHGKKTNKAQIPAPERPPRAYPSQHKSYSARLPPTTSDSCKEQHKKLRTTSVQPFKPFRLRTEERGALKELELNKELAASIPQLEEQGDVKKLREQMMHHALKMPSFCHPFRPQRSTKKLTVPKEPNFHSTRSRKTCTKHHLEPSS